MDFLPLYEEIGLGTTIWSPLASGVLTNKYAQGFPEGSRLSLKENEWLKQRFETPDGREKITKAAQLEPIAKDLNITLAQMSLAWCLKNPHVSTVITGASTVSQLEENLKALQYVDLLTPAVMEKIEAILQNKPQSPKDWRV